MRAGIRPPKPSGGSCSIELCPSIQQRLEVIAEIESLEEITRIHQPRFVFQRDIRLQPLSVDDSQGLVVTTSFETIGKLL